MKEKLIQLFRECFASLADAKSETIINATIKNVDDWESITALNLLMLLEAEFGISIPDEDAANLTSFTAILSYLLQA